MVFLWGLSDSKFPLVSRNLHSILANLNNAVFWMVSTRPVISKSSSLCTNPLMTVPRAATTIGITVTFMFHSFFLFPCKIDVFILLFAVFQFYSVVSSDSKANNSVIFFFLVDYYKVWSSGWDQVIRLYLKIPETHVHLILQDKFLVIHIPFVRMVKLKFLAQFQVDHLDHPVVSSLILFQC